MELSGLFPSGSVVMNLLNLQFIVVDILDGVDSYNNFKRRSIMTVATVCHTRNEKNSVSLQFLGICEFCNLSCRIGYLLLTKGRALTAKKHIVSQPAQQYIGFCEVLNPHWVWVGTMVPVLSS